MANSSYFVINTETQEPMNIRLIDNGGGTYSNSTHPPFSTTRAQQFNVTTSPSEATNVRMGIYQGPIWDSP